MMKKVGNQKCPLFIDFDSKFIYNEQCLVSTTFFCPPPPPVSCAAESQPVSNIRVEERFGGGRGGVWFGCGKSLREGYRLEIPPWPTSCPRMIYIFSFKMLY
jgi:hypothetical protein